MVHDFIIYLIIVCLCSSIGLKALEAIYIKHHNLHQREEQEEMFYLSCINESRTIIIDYYRKKSLQKAGGESVNDRRDAQGR